MPAPLIRPARASDVEELVAMRRDFTYEDGEHDPAKERPGYEAECRAFLERVLASASWHVWVAEVDGELAAHVFVALVERVPRPVRQRALIAYLTNVYTRPGQRGLGLGGTLLRRAQESAREAGAELMLVWPSEESAAFYARHGFGSSDAPIVWHAGRNE